MAFQLSDGTPIPVGSAFTIGEINYPANWLNLSTAEEKTAAGIVEVADPTVYDSKFYYSDGTAKALDDKNSVDGEGNLIKYADGSQHITYGVKTILKNREKDEAASRLASYDWYVVRKIEKGTEIPTKISTYRDAVRAACNTREAEIDACSDTAALITLYQATEKDGVITPNMTQYPIDPNMPSLA